MKNQPLVEVKIYKFRDTTEKERKDIIKYLKKVASDVSKAGPEDYSNNPHWTLFK